MRVLVTGANGHIGANLVRDLLNHDYDVVTMVRKAPITRAQIDTYYGMHFAYDCSKAATQLVFVPRPARDAVSECLRWGAFIGALKPDIAKKVLDQFPAESEWLDAMNAE